LSWALAGGPVDHFGCYGRCGPSKYGAGRVHKFAAAPTALLRSDFARAPALDNAFQPRGLEI
jgi:hypothetical protein